jgi:hypothetical protein
MTSCISEGPPYKVRRLHKGKCNNSEEDILRMESILEENPGALDAPQMCTAFLNGISLTARPHGFIAPLHDAIVNGHEVCVKYFLEKGADLHQPYALTRSYKATTFQVLYNIEEEARARSEDNYHQIFQILLEYGTPLCNWPRREFQIKMNVLHRAIETSTYDEVKQLLQLGAMTTYPGYSNNRMFSRYLPLQVCFDNLMLEKAKLLMMYDPDIRNAVQLPNNFAPCRVPIHYKRSRKARKTIKKYIKFLKLYKNFGGTLEVNPPRTCPIRNLLSNNNLRDRFVSKATPYYNKVARNPLSLQACTRLAIHRHLGRRYIDVVPQLNLPTLIINLLKYDDLEPSIDI